MKKLRIKLNKRGVSPIIATLLLVAIAVAAAVVTYTWTMSMAQNQSTQSQTSVKIDQVLFGRAETAGTTLDEDTLVGATNLLVVSSASFQDGDFVLIDNDEVRIVIDVPDATHIQVAALARVHSDTDPVELLNDGALLMVRNTGSIAATIETAYVFEGDALITSTDGIALDTVLSPGEDAKIGISDVTAWSSLKSGGLSLPTQDGSVIPEAFTVPLVENTPYRIRLVTTTGFIVEGTYYAPGSFSS